MTFKDILKPPRILLPLVGAAGSYLASQLAFSMYERFPTYKSVACGESGSSGCMEWGFITIGPFYLIGLFLFAVALFMGTLAPLALALALWLSPLAKKPLAEGKEGGEASRMTVWGAVKAIISRTDPNA